MYLINNLPTTLQLLQGTISIPPLGYLKISQALINHQDVNYAVYNKGWATLSETAPGDIAMRESQVPTVKLSTPDVGMTIEELREAQAKEEASKVELEPNAEKPVEPIVEDEGEPSRPTRRGRQPKSQD